MHLRQLSRQTVAEAFRHDKALFAPLLRQLARRKRRHSINVGRSLYRAGAEQHVVHAGLVHDYLERGGNLERLHTHLDDHDISPRVAALVRSLSTDEDSESEQEDNAPLAHLRQVLADGGLTQEMVNDIVLAKLADRLDNLRRRAKRGRVGKNYRRKSVELVEFLRSRYRGASAPFEHLWRKVTKLLG